MLLKSITSCLESLVSLLTQITHEELVKPSKPISNATIGEHIRHCIEMLQCLENNYEIGTINYDTRARDKRIETDKDFAILQLKNLQKSIGRDNKTLYLQQNLEDTLLEFKTNYYRELLYNFEHCIHHQALIKVAVLDNKSIQIDPSFGVANATIAHKKQCVQ